MSRNSIKLANINNKIGERIQEKRVSKGLSRAQLCERIEITHQQLQKYEKGINRVSAARLQGIAEALGEHPAYFYETNNQLLGGDRDILEISRIVRTFDKGTRKMIAVFLRGISRGKL